MKKLLFLFAFVLLICINTITAQVYRMNFESGGYISGLYPAPFPSGISPNINNQVLYCKTDIGGVYKSTNNGNSWINISYNIANSPNCGYEISRSELITQGLALHPTNPNRLVIAWGNDSFEGKMDTKTRDFKCLLITTNGGTTWERPSSISEGGAMFSGDNFRIKTGGECIIYDPRSANSPDYDFMYMGGYMTTATTNGKSNLFKSTNGGSTWSIVSNFASVSSSTDTIVSITMHPAFDEIFVGTNKGLYRSPDLGTTWYFYNTYYDPGLQFNLPLTHVRRILLKNNNDQVMAFIAHGFGNVGDDNYRGLVRFTATSSSGGDFKNLAIPFESGSGSYNQTPDNYFSTLTFYDGGETKLLAGRQGRPLRYTTNNGNNWTGNHTFGGPQVLFKYPTTLPTNFSERYPDHQHLQDWIFTGLSSVRQNPYFSDYWYSSSGAGPHKSTNGGINYVSPTNQSTWNYMNFGQSMPVVYDVTINEKNYSNLFVSLSDWTLGYGLYSTSNTFYHLNYDRRTTLSMFGADPTTEDTKIPNVRRALPSQEKHANDFKMYMIGGNVYTDYAFMYKRLAYSAGTMKTGSSDITSNHTPFTVSNRSFPDGIIDYNSSTEKDRIIVLLGASKTKKTINEESALGLYKSNDGGDNWSKCFPESNINEESSYEKETESRLNYSIIPPAFSVVNGLFDNQFNLSNSDNPAIKLMYLEGQGEGGTNPGGGFFISTNEGTSWIARHKVVQDNDYKGEGSIKFANFGSNDKRVFITISQDYAQFNNNTKRGLYWTTFNGTSTGETWTRHTYFGSAKYVDTKIDNQGRKLIVVYGKRDYGNNVFDDVYKLYYSSDGGSTWNLISNTNHITGVSTLRFNPGDCRKYDLFVGTSGSGVFRVTLPFSSFPYACALIVANDVIINSSMQFEGDVIIQDSGKIICEANATIKMTDGSKIIIEEGGSLIIDSSANVIFTKSDNATSWGGIEIQGNSSVDLRNCVFENTSTPISILGPETVPLFANQINIENCTFNDGNVTIEDRTNINLIGNTWEYTNQSQEISGILATGSGNLLIKNNTINYLTNLDPSTAIALVYCDNNTTVFGNVINNTSTGISVSNSSPFIAWNKITNEDPGTIMATGIALDNSYAAVINKNEITDCFNGIQLYYSSPTMYGNIVNFNGADSESNGLFAEYQSHTRLSPTISSGTDWDAGNNHFYYGEGGNAIKVDDSEPSLECGYNLIFGNVYHIYGSTRSQSGELDATNNNWYNNPPGTENFDLDVDVQYDLYVTNPPVFNNSPSAIPYYEIEDTLLASDNSSCDSEEENSGIYAAATIQERNGNYSQAKNLYEMIISANTANVYAIMSMKRILHCMDKMNSNSEAYGSLRTYYSNLNTNHQSDTSFSHVAAELATKCLVRQKQFSSAISEYEDVVTSSGSPGQVLNAQLNIIETYLIAQSGGDNMGGDFTGRLAALKPTDVKDALKKMNLLLGRNKKQENIITSIPETFELSQNYPNPFNPVTKINFALPVDGKVSLVIYDMLGREMAKLVNSELRQAGRHTVEFNGSNLASGIYFYRLIVEGEQKFVQAKKMVMIK